MSRKIFYLDALERVAWTFIQGFLAFWIVTGEIDSETLVAALVAGALSAAKTILATRIGDRNSAATLPSPPDFAPKDDDPPMI